MCSSHPLSVQSADWCLPCDWSGLQVAINTVHHTGSLWEKFLNFEIHKKQTQEHFDAEETWGIHAHVHWERNSHVFGQWYRNKQSSRDQYIAQTFINVLGLAMFLWNNSYAEEKKIMASLESCYTVNNKLAENSAIIFLFYFLSILLIFDIVEKDILVLYRIVLEICPLTYVPIFVKCKLWWNSFFAEEKYMIVLLDIIYRYRYYLLYYFFSLFSLYLFNTYNFIYSFISCLKFGYLGLLIWTEYKFWYCWKEYPVKNNIGYVHSRWNKSKLWSNPYLH